MFFARIGSTLLQGSEQQSQGGMMKLKRRGNVFFTAVAVAVLITGVTPAAASTGEGNRPSVWAQSADRTPADSTPTLSDDIGAPEGGGTELLLGLGLIALAGLVLVF